MASKSYSQNFTKSYQVVFEKIHKCKCNRKIQKKIHLILIQSKIPFGCTKSVALRYYFWIFTNSYQVVFEKSSLYFTSPMKISKSKSNNKTLKNQFNFDSIKISFWVDIDTGIRMLFTWFHKQLLSSFWKILTLLQASFCVSPAAQARLMKLV